MKKKIWIVEGIKNLLKTNYGIDTDTVNVDDLVDNSLTFGENWAIIKEKIHLDLVPYEKLACRHCSRTVKAHWKFCAYCGREI